MEIAQLVIGNGDIEFYKKQVKRLLEDHPLLSELKFTLDTILPYSWPTTNNRGLPTSECIINKLERLNRDNCYNLVDDIYEYGLNFYFHEIFNNQLLHRDETTHIKNMPRSLERQYQLFILIKKFGIPIIKLVFNKYKVDLDRLAFAYLILRQSHKWTVWQSNLLILIGYCKNPSGLVNIIDRAHKRVLAKLVPHIKTYLYQPGMPGAARVERSLVEQPVDPKELTQLRQLVSRLAYRLNYSETLEILQKFGPRHHIELELFPIPNC